MIVIDPMSHHIIVVAITPVVSDHYVPGVVVDRVRTLLHGKSFVFNLFPSISSYHIIALVDSSFLLVPYVIILVHPVYLCLLFLFILYCLLVLHRCLFGNISDILIFWI